MRAALERDEHETDEETLAAALALSEGSVRRALELVSNGGIELYREILPHSAPCRRSRARISTVSSTGSRARAKRSVSIFISPCLGLIERLIHFTATGEAAAGAEACRAALFAR